MCLKHVLEDICFIIYIDKTSSPGNYQCDGIEIEQINSDLMIGHNYNYHFLWGERGKIVKYTIEEISIDDIDKRKFFEWIFDEKSRLNKTLGVRHGL